MDSEGDFRIKHSHSCTISIASEKGPRPNDLSTCRNSSAMGSV